MELMFEIHKNIGCWNGVLTLRGGGFFWDSQIRLEQQKIKQNTRWALSKSPVGLNYNPSYPFF